MRKLLEKRTAIVAEIRSLAASPAGDGGDLSEEQEIRFHNLKVDLEKLEKRIERQALIDEADRRSQGVSIGGGMRDFERECRDYSLVRAIASQVPDLAGRVDCGRELVSSCINLYKNIYSTNPRSMYGQAGTDN
jgi:transcription elongation GreA/GreB family factor